MMRSVARVETDQPERYLKQLVSHLSHRLRTTLRDDGTGEVVFDVGRCTLVPGPGTLVLDAEATDQDGLARVCDVVGRHLERFGARNELQVRWSSS